MKKFLQLLMLIFLFLLRHCKTLKDLLLKVLAVCFVVVSFENVKLKLSLDSLLNIFEGSVKNVFS